MLLALAWRNLWRQKTRTFLSVASIAFTGALLLFMFSMQLGTYETMKNNTLRLFDGFAQIQPPGYSDDPDVSNFLTAPDAIVARLLQVPGVEAAAPRATSFVILANEDISYGAAIVGVDPATEPKITTVQSSIAEGRYLRPGDDDAIIVGATLARNLGVGLGDRVTMLGSGADRSIAADSLRIVGLFKTGISDVDRQFAQMPISRFRDTFAMPDGANMIAIGGARLADVNRVLPQLRAIAGDHGLVLRDWAQLQPALRQAITLDMSTAGAIYFSLVVVVVFITLNTLYMSVFERTREFGMLLAIGMKPGALGRMMWIELILLALIGAGAGIVLGSAVTYWFQGYGIPIAGAEELAAQFGLPSRIYPALSWFTALAGPLALVFSVTLGGLVPFFRILRLRPVSAMGAT